MCQPEGDTQTNLRKAISCCEAALQVYARDTFPREWVAAQNNRGMAYLSLRDENRQSNLETAIACFQSVLEILSREEDLFGWAALQNNLGYAHHHLPQGNRQAHLNEAFIHYQFALQAFMEMHLDSYADTVVRSIEKAELELRNLGQA